jgi:hypothetical protein
MFEAFNQLLAETSQTAHLVQMFDSTVARAPVTPAQKGESKIRRPAAHAAAFHAKSTSKQISTANRVSSDRRRGQRLHAARNFA